MSPRGVPNVFFTCFLVVGGLLGIGCDFSGVEESKRPAYVGAWVDEDREVVRGRSTTTVDFYLVFTKNRVTEWGVFDAEEECLVEGADVVDYTPSSNRMVVAPDSGDVVEKVYVEPVDEQLVYSAQYIFYTLGQSDTLKQAATFPSNRTACSNDS